MVRILQRAGLALLIVAASWPVEAQYCYRPSPPSCVGFTWTYDSDFSFQQCRRSLERYLSDIDAYVDCLQRDIDALNYEADDVIGEFNCRARGELYCF